MALIDNVAIPFELETLQFPKYRVGRARNFAWRVDVFDPD